jgi:DNA-binding transcriptional regulator YiaG
MKKKKSPQKKFHLDPHAKAIAANVANNPDEYLTPDQVAALLHVGKDTLQKWRQLRIGPPYEKINGRLIRYIKVKLHGFVIGRAA